MQVARFAAESFPSGSIVSLLLRRSAHYLCPGGSLALQSGAAAAERSSFFELNRRSSNEGSDGRQQLRGEHWHAEGDLLSTGGGGGRGGDWQLCGHGDKSTKKAKKLFKGMFGWDVLGNSTYVPQLSPSSAKPHSSLQAFGRFFSSAYSSSTSKFIEPSDVHEYNKLISAINYKKRAFLVRDVYEDMLLDGVQPSQETFFLLMDGCMKGSRLQDVMYFFEEMKTMGLTPDVALYNCVIAACGRSKQVDRAFLVAAEMEASGIQPRHRTFLALLRTCAIAGRVDEAYGVVRRMAASGLTLDNNVYSALIIAYKNKKFHAEEDTKKIFELLEQSKQQSTEDLMAVAATGEFERTDDIDDGLSTMLLEDIQPRRGFINRRLAVYHAAVKSLGVLGNKEAVKTVLKLVEMDGHELDSFCIIQLIKFHLADGDFEQACAEYTKYVDTGRQPTLELYMVMIEGALDHCTPESSAIAQKLLADLVQKGYFLNSQLGSQLLQRACHLKSRDIAVAHVVWDMMKSREVRVSKYIVNEYYHALQRSDIPKDDPRLIQVKALAEQGKRVDFKGRADPTQTTRSDDLPGQTPLSEQVDGGQPAPSDELPGQTSLSEQVDGGQPAPSDDLPGQTSLSEQVDGQTAPLEMPSDQFDSVDEESPIENPSNLETLNLPPEEKVASNEKD